LKALVKMFEPKAQQTSVENILNVGSSIRTTATNVVGNEGGMEYPAID
jgi:hypothetical protein